MMLFFGISLYSQAPIGDFYNVYTLENKDTVKVHRTYGDIWYGVRGGVNGSIFYGQLNDWAKYENGIPQDNPFNSLLKYSGGSGLGFFAGLTGEYLPPGEDWGFTLNVNVLDKRKVASETDVLDTLQSYYELESAFNYICISTSVRYNLSIPGLHIFGGVDFDNPLTPDTKQRLRFRNPERIEEFQYVYLNDVKFRVGFNFGTGWDIFMADVRGKTSVRFTPFVSFHLGTAMVGDDGSDWNSVFARVGLSVKFGPDKIEYDTLPYNPNYVPPPYILAGLINNKGLEFKGRPMETNQLYAYVKIDTIPQVFADNTSKPIFKETEKPIEGELALITKTEPEKKPIKNEIDLLKKFSFPSSASTGLTTDMKDYFNDLAEFLKRNPGYEVRVMGHSDNQGTFSDRADRARKRAEAVREYLNKEKNVPNGRVLVGSNGALSPVSSNDTEEGRRKNRRVEITVVKSK